MLTADYISFMNHEFQDWVFDESDPGALCPLAIGGNINSPITIPAGSTYAYNPSIKGMNGWPMPTSTPRLASIYWN